MTADRLVKLADGMIEYGFYVLAFLTPLLFTQLTYELFEFPKMILVYTMTVIIATSFFARAIITGRNPLKRTPLDLPILVFLLVNIAATVSSVDHYTSIFGYYTRFNGGLTSTLCFVILFYLFYAELKTERRDILRSSFIRLILIGAFFVSLYAIFQHFGIDKDYWVQDVQRRVFSTLGQPNWLATYLIMVVPVGFAFMLAINPQTVEKTSKVQKKKILRIISLLKLEKKQIIAIGFLTLIYTAFWFTYSLSGLVGFVAMGLIFLLLVGLRVIRGLLKPLAFLAVACGFISLLTLSPTIVGKIQRTKTAVSESTTAASTSEQTSETIPPEVSGGVTVAQVIPPNNEPETGSTITIRMAVWKGTLRLIAAHPLLGTGPETFAYTFLPYRPADLNSTAEWDFLYNKAHNEYLNIAATTGLLGLGAYLWLVLKYFRQSRRGILASLKRGDRQGFYIGAGLIAGVVGSLVSNFFGFSVVVVNLLFWLFMALNLSFIDNE